MLRKLTPLLLVVPLAARAQSAWEEREWAGDDQYSWQTDSGNAGDAHDDWYAPQEPYENTPPPPPDDEYGAQQYGAAQPPPADYAEAGPAMDDFRSGLRPYGRWIDTPDYGSVWQPTRVSYHWQPYWDGRWVWTTAGWTWVTDEPWGWATYHYGRWALVDGFGWVWLPGHVWAPAWVAWRWGGGYAGWCPLGPRGVVYVQPRTWVFVETPHFLAPVRHHAVPISVITTVWPRVQPLPVVRPTPRAGPPPRVVEAHTRVPVRAVPIVAADSRGATRPLPSGALPVWRPRTIPYSRPLQPTAPVTSPVRAQPAPVTIPGRVQPSTPGRPPARVQSAPPVVTPGGAIVRSERRAMPVERPAAVQPVRPSPPAAVPVRRADPEGAARPSAAPHARPSTGAHEPERN